MTKNKDFLKRAMEFCKGIKELENKYECYLFKSPLVDMETGVVNVKGEFDFIPLSELEEEING